MYIQSNAAPANSKAVLVSPTLQKPIGTGCQVRLDIFLVLVQSTYPYNDNLYNDITAITIFSRQTKSLCSVYLFLPLQRFGL